MTKVHNSGTELLAEAADALEVASAACDVPEDSAYLSGLAGRVRSYLASSRSTTMLGMHQILSSDEPSADGTVAVRPRGTNPSHVRIVRG